uniref:Protein kinase domain-containing protein n=1 Tax=Oryzias melastigma TaxID=30732 RepID=A0A3B3DNV7_ORYME
MATGTSLRHIPIALSGNKSFYLKRHSLGEGAFGAVFLYQQHPTLKDVAVKFLNHKYGQKEANILEKIKGLNPDKNNLLKLVEHFTEGWHYCIVFEKLDQDLGHFMSVKTQQRMKVSEIRPVAQQILTALQALKSMGLVHTDIKPNNLMLVNHANHPFKVKLIDFGLARHKFDLSPNSKIQALGYRAPESVFDLPKDESVDMWGLGCSLAYMYLFRNLYPRTSEYEYIATIVQMQGIPPSYVLREGLRVQEFFLRSGSNFQFKTPSMYLGRSFTGLLLSLLASIYLGTVLSEIKSSAVKWKGLSCRLDRRPFSSQQKQTIVVITVLCTSLGAVLGHIDG